MVIKASKLFPPLFSGVVHFVIYLLIKQFLKCTHNIFFSPLEHSGLYRLQSIAHPFMYPHSDPSSFLAGCGIHSPPQWHSNRITQSPADLTWSVASDCVWGFLLFFMLCTCTLRRHHCVDDGHSKKAGDAILWQGSCTLASLLSETFSPVRLFWCTGHFFFFFKCKRNIFKALRD